MLEEEKDSEHYVVCGENLGVHRPYFTHETSKKISRS
jgi:ATP-dependent RNA circularization protein (DNA/RNA ligase family)